VFTLCRRTSHYVKAFSAQLEVIFMTWVCRNRGDLDLLLN